jgi:hypothetical protein
MTGRERLKAVQERLIARGVLDVKMTLAPNAYEHGIDKVAGDLADLLESYLDGRCRLVTSIGDRE